MPQILLSLTGSMGTVKTMGIVVIVLGLRPAVLDRHVLILDEASFLQSLAECAQTVRDDFRRCVVENGMKGVTGSSATGGC